MIVIQRCLLKPIEKSISRCLYRNISNISTGDKKVENTEDKNNDKKLEKKTDACSTKKPDFDGWDYFLPDRKGDVQVAIIGGSDASIYAAVLLKQSRLIKQIHLVDTKGSLMSAVLDANHIDTSTRIKYFKRRNLKEALKETNIIALMDETNLDTKDLNIISQFEAASLYVHEMAEKMVRFNSNSLVAVFAKPVTATLPMVSEVYKYSGWWDPDRIIGSTALDRMRMEAITANLLDLNPAFLSVPMVGGADSNSIVPLLSRASPINGFPIAQQKILLQSLRNADKKIANNGSKGPSLSNGVAAAKLILMLAGGLSGFENIISSAYVRSNVLPVCRFFTTELQFGTSGVMKNFGLPKISSSEISLVEQAIPLINECIEMAIKAVKSNRHITMKNT
ncbi:malate dehydrogenase, mitochondrial [Osmia lignaria lignaria]|uniref:malate dehydrogenase, mitochondrial n=1 Tax=Osmia lignaria lignaria TaxID=1437193 RepID=UPI00402B1D6E